MADNVPITAGSGTNVATDDVAGVHYQYVKLADGTLDSSAGIPGDATNGLWVNVKGQIALPSGSNIIGRVGIDQTTPGTTNRVSIGSDGVVQLATGTNTIGALTANQSVNLTQVAGTTAATGNGTATAGTQRVTVASDNTAFTVNAQMTPATSGGLTIGGNGATGKLISAATTNATSVKGSAGQVFGWFVSNTNAAPRYLKLYNKATAPTVGTDTPLMTILIPGNANGAGAVVEFTNGIVFSTGIALALTTGVSDADTTSVGASEIVVNLLYK